jgi:hypothetical protein
VLSLALTRTTRQSRASSHREAPLITADPLADNTDTYAFRSTEAGRSGFVTLLANWIPFEEPSGGPHFYKFDDTVLYEIKIDNTGDGNRGHHLPVPIYYVSQESRYSFGDGLAESGAGGHLAGSNR